MPTRRSPGATATPPARCSSWRATRGELAQPILPGLPDLLAEVALAARREQARSIGDVLFRRTRLALLAGREPGARARTAARPRSPGAPATCSRASSDGISSGSGSSWSASSEEARAEGIVPSCWQADASSGREPTSTAHAL